MERPDYASKKRIEKRLLYADGTQRTAYLGMVDDNGAFVYMCDTGEAEYLHYHSEAARMALYQSERDTARDELAAIKKLYTAQEKYIEELTKLIKWSVEIIDAAIVPNYTPDREEKSLLTQRKNRYKDAVAKKVVLDDDE